MPWLEYYIIYYNLYLLCKVITATIKNILPRQGIDRAPRFASLTTAPFLGSNNLFTLTGEVVTYLYYRSAYKKSLPSKDFVK